MPRAPAPAKPRRKARPTRKGIARESVERPATKVAVPVAQPAAPKPRIDEPVWLVRIVLVLFLVGFAAFLAREVYSFVQALG